ncbi:MAG: hypothetical protein OXE59_07500 [Bacteroidetes bacterium]|nr:hypothetical protein [Bacteroidota bacterium]
MTTTITRPPSDMTGIILSTLCIYTASPYRSSQGVLWYGKHPSHSY